MIHMENKDLHVAIVLSPICGPIAVTVQKSYRTGAYLSPAISDRRPVVSQCLLEGGDHIGFLSHLHYRRSKFITATGPPELIYHLPYRSARHTQMPFQMKTTKSVEVLLRNTTALMC